MVSNHSKVGYEPTLIPDHTGVEESSGNDPQSVSHRSQCLAGMSRRLQGLLSVVGTVGIEPTWDLLTFQPRIRRRVYVPWWRQLRF